MNHSEYGWAAWAPEILDVGRRVRTGRVFDEAARSSRIAQQVAEVRSNYPGWLLWLVLPALLFPVRWIIAGLIVVIWAVLKIAAHRQGQRLHKQLTAQSTRLRAEVAEENRVFSEAVLRRAEVGDPSAATDLIRKWAEHQPESVSEFSAVVKPGESRAWLIGGRAHPRSAIPARIPRIGSRGRTVHDRRKAAEIDEDVTELNAAAVLSVLLALLGKAPQQVHVVIHLDPEQECEPVEWVVLDGTFTAKDVENAYMASEVPSAAIIAMGGTVGLTRSKRLRPANPTNYRGAESLTPFRMDSIDGQDDAYGRRAATLIDDPAASLSPERKIPQPPADFVVTVSAGTRYGSRNAFLQSAREHAHKCGSADAPFAPFMSYWPTYSVMDARQLRYYFRWRHAFRSGELLQIDLSYLFLHVYELLHQVGVQNAAHAGSELERLWIAYRHAFPKIDRYLVGWIADFYAVHGSQEQVLAWYRRALSAGADVQDRELVTDLYWAPGNYEEMPNPVVATLIGATPGGNKFYREHNTDGWIDRGYRHALAIGDRAFHEVHRKTVREVTLERDGTRTISREPFVSAVYELPRKAIVLGRVPALKDGGIALTTFANVVRFAENLMRVERAVGARLRGINLDPAIARNMEAQFGLYLRRSRPKPKVTIDLAKVRDLTSESAEVRSILLAGGEAADAAAADTAAAKRSAPAARDPALPSDAPDGLLTDLHNTAHALSNLPPACMAVVRTIADSGWEVDEGADELRAAAEGALVGPLIDSINDVAKTSLGDVLIVTEGGRLVLQDDFRDEIHYLLRGSLEGFVRTATYGDEDGAPVVSSLPDEADEADGFGPSDIAVLSVLLSGTPEAPARIAKIAASVGTMPLILLDQINETALAGQHGDLIVDADSSAPAILEYAESYVRDLLARVGACARRNLIHENRKDGDA